MRNYFYNEVRTNPGWTVGYLKLARFLTSYGLTPPFSMDQEKQEKRWRELGTNAYSKNSRKMFKQHHSLIRSARKVIGRVLTCHSSGRDKI